jgi:transposase
VIEWETRVLLKHYLERGISKAALAARFGIHRRTIERWARSGQLDRALDEPPRYRPRPPVVRKLDPYRTIILTRLDAYPELSAVRLLEEVEAAGYPGGYSQIRDYVRGVRPRPVPDPVIRFETPPAKQAQVDFAEFRCPWGKRFALLVILGYSRLLWVRFFRRQDMRSLFEGLEGAFAAFGGIPEHLLFDQARTVVQADFRLDGGELIMNAEFGRFARHWGFEARACRAYRARTKGKVERPVRFVRGNFFYGRTFLNDADLEEQLGRWLEKSNRRVHGTTRERPVERFERDELALLQPVAPRPYHSMVLPAPAPERPSRRAFPPVPVERRSLATYAAVAGGAR